MIHLIKGIIYAPCLNDVSEEETKKELRPHGVASVYKFTKKVDNFIESKCCERSIFRIHSFDF